MRKGEIGIFAVMGLVVLATAAIKGYNKSTEEEPDKGIPFYTTASDDLAKQARALFSKYNCHACHSLWTKKSIMQNVPAPALDGLGSIRSEEWFYNYFSAESPQDILPTRLKKEFQI